MDWFLFTASGDGNEGEGEGTGGFLLCHDKIYLTPLRLYSILMIPIICNQFCIVLPLYSLTDDWSPLRSPYPKTPPDLPPFTDKLLTGSEIHKSDVTFSAVVPISFISIRIRFWNLETPTIRQFVLIFSYLDTNINEADHTAKLKLFTIYICRQNGVSFLIVLLFPWQRFPLSVSKIRGAP